MLTVRKLALQVVDTPQTLMLPAGSEIVYAALDPQGIPSVWVWGETTTKRVARRVVIRRTDTLAPPRRLSTYVGTFITAGNVWHLFDLGEDRSVRQPAEEP